MHPFKIILILLLSTFSCTTNKPQPTSEIPERREFPLSKKVGPCENFFEYVCSEALNNFKLRDDRSAHTFAFHDSYDRILEHKKSYLKGLLTQTTFNERSQQLHDYYASCMDQGARATEEKDILQKNLDDLKKIKNKYQFYSFLTNNALSGKKSHLSFFNDANLDDPNIYDFFLRPAKMMSLPERSYYKKKELMVEFKKLVVEFFKIAGVANPKEQAKWVIHFETEFAENYPLPEEQRQRWSRRKYSSKKELRGLKNLALNQILKKVPSKTKIRNPLDDVFIYLNKAMGKATLAQLKAVYLYHSTNSILDEGFPEYYKKKFDFRHKFLGGAETRTVLNERCAQDMWRFNKEIDAELFETIFPNFPEDKFVATLNRVKDEIAIGMKENKWLSPRSKRGAIRKIKLAKFQVVKPKNDLEWDFNPKANYNPQTYIGNKVLLSKKHIDRRFKRLPKKVNRKKWYMGPLTVNAYYDPSNNKFVMPAGILQYPFYDANLNEWQNLGAVGAVVGHELGHGVDDQGAKYDAYGSLNQWMSDRDIKMFKEKGQKLAAHFDKAGHNGKLTLGENIGDLVGLTFAHKAAQKVMPSKPSARAQAEREFYIQYAKVWCGKMRPKMEERRLKTGPHSLGWARVNEQVKHQPAFEKAFSCRAGDKMVLPNSERVQIW